MHGLMREGRLSGLLSTLPHNILKGITMSKTITSDELEIMLNGHNPPRVIDVRRKSDYESDPSMIPGAVWLDPEKVEDWSKELGDEDVVIYCVRGGSVSKSTLEKLHGHNINYFLTINIYNCISDFS